MNAAMLATVNLSAPDAPIFFHSPRHPLYPKYADTAHNFLSITAPRCHLLLSLYYSIPQHDFSPPVAVTKTPPPGYPLVPEPTAMPVFQPIEVARQPSRPVATLDGKREDGLSAAMRIDLTPPGFILKRHQHLPPFSGEMLRGRLPCLGLLSTSNTNSKIVQLQHPNLFRTDMIKTHCSMSEAIRPRHPYVKWRVKFLMASPAREACVVSRSERINDRSLIVARLHTTPNAFLVAG